MIGDTRMRFSILLAFLTLLALLAALQPARAQFFDESLEQEDLFIQDEDQFFEPGVGDEFGAQESPELDLTEGNRFIDESLIPGERRVTEGGREFQLTLGQERQELPLNIAWGAGTGLLIGGWFALIGEGDNRETQRSIGLGIVVGILLGTLVGARSVITPGAPRPVSQAGPPQDDPPPIAPLVTLAPNGSRLGVRLTF
jgi:hypothetical protein